MLLLSTAGLKLYGLNYSPLPGVGWLSTPQVQLAVVVAEILVGVALIFDIAKPLNWLAALTMFGGFAGVSGYFGMIGQASCGCFGTIEASPWAAFTVDVVAIALLLIGRPKRTQWTRETLLPSLRTAGVTVGGTAVVVAVLAGISLVTFGSVSAGVARLRGRPIEVAPYVDFGHVESGSLIDRPVRITNWSNEPVRIIGGTSDCSCITTGNMPCVIEPNDFVEINVRLKVPAATSGTFTRTAWIWTDRDGQRTIKFRLGCRAD